MTHTKGGIPTGWNDGFLDSYKKISERNPQVQQVNGDDTSNGYEAADGRSGSVSSKSSGDSGDINNSEPQVTRMAEESTDDDLDTVSPPKVKSFPCP